MKAEEIYVVHRRFLASIPGETLTEFFARDRYTVVTFTEGGQSCDSISGYGDTAEFSGGLSAFAGNKPPFRLSTGLGESGAGGFAWEPIRRRLFTAWLRFFR